MPPLEILFEDNHCLAIYKPAGALSTHFQGREETLDRLVKRYLKEKHAKPGNVFLGIVHRLDRPVSGVLLFARTSKAAARLAQQFREGTVEKIYWAVVEGTVQRSAGTLEDWLLKVPPPPERGRAGSPYPPPERGRAGSPYPPPERGRAGWGGRVEVVEPRTRGARQALLHYQVRARHDGLTWLEVRPQTGRTHQLRVQLAHHGYPIYGDSRYGSVHTLVAPSWSADGQQKEKGIALHARALTFLHPVRYEPVTLTADLPRSWRGRFAYLFAEVQK